MYYRGAHAAIIVYDIRSRESFEYAKTWVQTLRDEVTKHLSFHLHFASN